MKKSKIFGAIGGALVIVAPVLTAIVDAMTRDKEMDAIADRVVQKIEERESNVSKASEESAAAD